MISNFTHKPNANTFSIALYCDKSSSRLIYTCDFIFNQVLKVNYKLLNQLNDFQAHAGPKINLSANQTNAPLQIILQDFIFEVSLSKASFSLVQEENRILLIQEFSSKPEKTELDLFSSVFFFISRHEEWSNQNTDQHGRFEVKASILHKQQLQLKPLIDIWIQDFKNLLERQYLEVKFPENQFQIISTIDVDNVFAFKGKPIVRSLGGLLKQLLRFDLIGFKHRLQTLLFQKKDPFDIYDSVSEFCADHKIPLCYFFLFKTGTKYDRSIDPSAKAYDGVFEQIKKHKANIGLHPSYNSAYDFGLLKHEKEALENRSAQKILMSRQHFLRFDIKSTPHLLLQQGIKLDSTMGFASEPGFRAGTSHPFYYYDFHTEKTTELLMLPFCAMDGAYTHYNTMPAEKAFESMLLLGQEIKKTGGYFTFVYHERSFYDHLYKDYGDLYKKIILALK